MKRYSLIVLGQTGMYTCGDAAATPELARLCPGNLVRESSNGQVFRLGIIEFELTGSDSPPKAQILVEAEEEAGQWKIGP